MVESQLSYEKRLKDCDEIITRFRGDAGVLKKKNGKIAKDCEDLRKEIELLRSQHVRLQETIRQNQKQIEELKHDRVQRDSTIKDKEKQLIEMNKKNQELEKTKLYLTNKIQELKGEIEPRDVEIREKKERIFEMERELKLLQQHQLRSSLKLSELKDRILGADKELKLEKSRSKFARDHLMKICTDIHDVSSYIQSSPEKLKERVISLFNRYANNSELKKSLTHDSEVQNEFLRQRDYYEKMTKSSTRTTTTKSKVKDEMDSGTVKLLKENVELVTELNRLRVASVELQKENQQMKQVLGTSSRKMLPSEAKKKLLQATAGKDDIDKQYLASIEQLNEKIEILMKENQDLRSKIAD
jgi:cilia- and flagella-associated protein 57